MVCRAAIVAFVAALGFAGGASAGAAAEPEWSDALVSVRVAASDLDLSREHDARVLIERVNRGARIACGAGQVLISHRAACARASAEQAIRALGLPTLTALYYRTTPGQPAALDAGPVALTHARPASS